MNLLNKNEDYIFEIKSQGYEGEGIAKTEEGYTVFIPGALTGEKVKAKVVKVKKSYSYGKLLEVIEEAPNRQLPPCPVYKACGGCSLQHTTYETQLQLKQERVMDCMSKIGGLDPSLVLPTLGMENPFRYRNKVQLPVGMQKGKLQIGFFAPRSHNIVDTPACLIQDEAADKIVAIIREWIIRNKIKPYIVDGEYSKEGELRHIMVRRGFKTDEIMVVLVAAKRTFPATSELIAELTAAMPSIKSIMLNYNSKATNVILGEENTVLYGEDHITDYIGDFRFKISPLSFFQVNPVQTEVLYGKALEYAGLTGEETVFDAYCGTGTISLFLSQKAKKVYGVEIVPQAIDNAIENARDNNVNNAEFFVGEAEKVIPQLIKKGIKADVVVVDPPRKGCGRELLEGIGEMSPRRIVYVSCDPSTLARDLAILEDRGYKTQKVQPVDMFPQTAHVETCVLLSHKNPQTSPPSL